MASSNETGKASLAERAARLARNVNIVGGIALLGLSIIAPAAAAANYITGAKFATLGAGASEGARRVAKKSK